MRLELTDSLKGSYRILEEHGIAIKDLYGSDTKHNIKYDDRNTDLMMDVKLPGNQKWHNITVEQARQAKKIRERAGLSQGKSIAGPSLDRERAKGLMLVYSPQKSGTPMIMATGANLIDIESSFHEGTSRGGGDDGRSGVEEDDEEERSGDESDESMSKLLHGRKNRTVGWTEVKKL